MAKSKTNTQTKKAQIDALLAEVDQVFELVIAWKPGASRPVSFLFLKINDIAIVTDTLDTDSPFTVKVPRTFEGHEVTLSWAIAPEVDVSLIAIGLQKRGQSGAKKIAVNETGVKRGDIWNDKAKFTVA